jgi:serine/threonine protein kinase
MAYVSPEALATGHTSTKEDMWSLGCVITELVTGKHVSDRAPGSTFARNQGAVAQAIAEVGIKDTDLGDLVRILFEADCDKRPTAHEVLWKHLKHLPFQVPPEKPLPVVPADLAKIQATHLSALSKSPDIPTLVSAILRKDDFKMMEVSPKS